MKRVQTVCVAILLLLAFAAGAHAQSETTLEMYMGFTREQSDLLIDRFEDYLAAYERMNPGVKINARPEALHDPDEMFVLLVASEEPPAIIKTGVDHLIPLYAEGLLDPMPPQMAAEVRRSMFPVAVEGVTFAGELIGVPIENNVTGILYSREVLAESGVAAPPRTWDELHAMGPSLVRVDATGEVTRPAIFDPGEPWSLAFHVIAAIHSEGGAFVDADGNLRLDEPPTYVAIERFTRALTASPPYMGLGWQWFGRFADQKDMPLGFGFPWYVQGWSLDDLAAVGAVPSPAGAAGHGAVYYSHAYAVPARSSYKQEAWKLLEWLALRDGGEGIAPLGELEIILGSWPMRQQDIRAAQFEERRAFLEPFIEGLSYAIPNTQYMSRGATAWVETGLMVLRVASGEMSPTQAVEEARRQNQVAMDDWAF